MSFQSRSSRKERPSALDIESTTDSESLLPPPFLSDTERAPSSGSVGSSSLDPYYFSIVDPNATTLDPRAELSPVTPARDPATIDRRGLVGVGELSTPRWTNRESGYAQWTTEPPPHLPGVPESAVVADDHDSGSSSPWTIEAIDGEGDELEPLPTDMGQRAVRPKHSLTEESGGEEILYPRHQPFSDSSDVTRAPDSQAPLGMAIPLSTNSISQDVVIPASPEPTSPPSAFSPILKAKKRTSDEFLMDQTTGHLVSKFTSAKEDSTSPSSPTTTAARRHRSLGASTATSARINKRRVPGTGVVVDLDELHIKTLASPTNHGKHARHASASASSSSSDTPGRRNLNHAPADFSHLPPSPSSSSIQQFLRANPNGGPVAVSTPGNNENHSSASTPKSNPLHSPPSVAAHSIVKGTQEGWPALDDKDATEILRKLDGLSGKTVHARSSMSFKTTSRPGTPGRGGGFSQWEGIETRDKSKRQSVISYKGTDDAKSRRSSAGSGKESGKDHEQHDIISGEVNDALINTHLPSDEIHQPVLASAVPSRGGRASSTKDGVTTNVRSSLTAKRGSASSTNFGSTPTTSSRDSTTFSTSTSVTSAISARSSLSKRRNSGGSDVSSIHSNDAGSLRDRVASLAALGSDNTDEQKVPPVPPLPKDLGSFKSTTSAPTTSVSLPPLAALSPEDPEKLPLQDAPSVPSVKPSPPQSYIPPPSNPTPQTVRSPSKKWSFSGALNKLQSTSSRELRPPTSTISLERPVSFAYTPDNTTHHDIDNNGSYAPAITAKSSVDGPLNRQALFDNDALTTRSSMSSLRVPGSTSTSPAGFRDRSPSFSSSRTHGRPETASSVSTHTTGQPPLSPRLYPHQNNRLTPSAIPYARRPSSQSSQNMYQQTERTSSSTLPSAPNTSSGTKPLKSASPARPPKAISQTPISPTTRKSVFSLLKVSSSRKNLQSQSEKEREREEKRERQFEKDKERRLKKEEEKDRSESRISVLIGRKRGKTVSSTDQKLKETKVVPLPPIQMSAIPPATAQRVADLTGESSVTPSTPSTISRSLTTSRVSASTISSLNKQSDVARTARAQLPTIAGSPSTSHQGTQSLQGSVSSQSTLTKDTPTKIPRMASRSSTVHSPTTLKSIASTLNSRRTSLNLSGYNGTTNSNASFDEFGLLESNGQSKVQSTPTVHSIVRSSPQPIARAPRTAASSLTNTGLPRKSTRDSLSFGSLRKQSMGSVVVPSSTESAPAPAPTTTTTTTSRTNRLSMLSPSKSLKLLTPKLSSSTPAKSYVSASSNAGLFKSASASSSRQSLSSPSPVPSAATIDEDELLGDEEMMAYIKRQQTRKLANGAKKEELEEMLKFPEPTIPVSSMAPNAVLNSSLGDHLSAFERQEILDYPSVYYVGQGSNKIPATPDVTANNNGYDDERGDYLVINHDHLGYRYEIIDTLGKGSFGQVLNCRDHATGQSVAIKIIRNKKRFHHQALVEIKILESLRKWDPDEKHHVIKMTEHFYFRNHLCIAMELLSINLYELIKANGFVGFTTALIRRFTTQMLSSLILMRQHHIVHCDLKPENVLLRHPCKSGIKVIDFGSSCFEHEKVYTYIQSRFYRSPEVILGMNYHTAIDMWSLGCILAELYTGYPIFPGENEQEQLSCIMEVLGLPDKDLINRSSRKRLFFDSNGAPRPVVNSKGRRRRPGTKSLAQVLRCDDELFVDFVAKCLIWDPDRRMKPQPALKHPFLSQLRFRSSKSITSTTPSKNLLSSASLSGSGSSSSRNTNNKIVETPKKSQIGAPTPLAARNPRAPTVTVPQTPVGSNVLQSLGPRYRASVSNSHTSTTTIAK
ncbi:hypothetical protein Clacol_006665 [Clathrus columnatus]|uniref:dual-specificity kinase n=1 Tax=Clathrus columnatus TaxID=1419009 RepID=A0AAV5AFZ6_9AGAM|nr:hypothetical protein Clacol_006665 [Clathrus columnatus]